MFTNFSFLSVVPKGKNVYEACRNVELSYERVGSGTAIREARYALEVLLDYYIQRKGLSYDYYGLPQKIDAALAGLSNSGIYHHEFFKTDRFDYIRKLGNVVVHDSEIEFSGYPLHREAIEILRALQEIALALIVDLDVNFLTKVENYEFSDSYELLEDVPMRRI